MHCACVPVCPVLFVCVPCACLPVCVHACCPLPAPAHWLLPPPCQFCVCVYVYVCAGMSFLQAAAIPETWLTAYQLLYLLAGVKKGDKVLVHAAGSGVGLAAIQVRVRS